MIAGPMQAHNWTYRAIDDQLVPLFFDKPIANMIDPIGLFYFLFKIKASLVY